MADIASELPIRTQLPGQVNYDDVIIKIGDGTTPSQLAAVDTHGSLASIIKDAAGNAIGDQNLSSSWWLQVVGPQVASSAPGTASAFASLTAGMHSATLPTLTDGQQAAIQLDASGRLWANVSNLPAAVDTNWGAVGASTIRVAAEVGNAAGSADFNFGAASAQTLRVAALIGNASGLIDYNFGAASAQTIRAAALIGNTSGAADFNNGATSAQTLRVAANLAVAGANVSATNPVPVVFSAAPLGTTVNNYNTASAIAAGSASNHIYTITASKTWQGKKIWGSASGLMKIEVRVSPDGSTYSTVWVGFNSAADPNIAIDLDQLVFLESGTGATVEVIRTNLDKKAMDVYSTISGVEV